MTACDLADAPKIRAFHVFFQMAFAVGRKKIDPADYAVGEAIRLRVVRHGLKPACLPDRVLVVVIGLYMDRFDDVLILDVVEKIFDEVVFAESCVGPPDSNGFWALHVGIVVIVDVPQVMMRIDDLHREGSPDELDEMGKEME